MRLILSLLITLLASPASAQCVGENLITSMNATTRAEFQVAINKHPYPVGNLWKAQKADSTIHILGTMHIGDPRLGPYLTNFWPIAKTADLILFEMNAEQMGAMQAEMASNSSMLFITDGPTLLEQMDEAEWQKLKDEMAARGVPGFLTAKMQPWYAAMMLAIPPCAMAMMAEQTGVDVRIMDFAKDNNIRTGSLESYQDVLAMFAGDDPEEVLNALRLALASSKNGDAMIATLIESYLTGDHRAIWELSLRVAKQGGEMDEAEVEKMFAETEGPMLTDRNISWMDVILPATKQGDNIIVAVGAAHLSGEKGLLYMLEQQGYSLSRIDGF